MSKHKKKNVSGAVIAIVGIAVFAFAGLVILSKTQNPLLQEWAAKVGIGEPVTVEGVAWVWEYTERADGSVVTPNDDSFVLSLIAEERRVSSTTDCNSLMGSYLLSGNDQLRFGSLASTKMFCQDSMESIYSEQLALVNGYEIKGGRLHLSLDRDFGTMVFVRK